MSPNRRARTALSRRRVLALLGAGAVGALAACTAPAPTATPAPAAKPADKPADKPAEGAKPAAAQSAAGKGRAPVQFRSWWNPSISQPMDQWDKHIRKDFPEKNGGVELNIEYVPFGDYFKKFLAGVAGDDVPDALHSSVVWGRDFYDLGTLAELDQYMRATPDMDPKKLIPVTNLYNQKDGKYYGHSWEGPDGSTIYYNVDMFKEAGIDPAYEKVKNWTWDDVVTNSQKLTKRQGDSVDVGGILVAVLGLQHFAAWLYTAGGKFYGDNVQSKAVFADDGKGAQVVEYHLDLLNKHKVSLPLSAERQDTNLFYQGKTAMLVGGLWSVSKFQTDAPKLNFDLAPIVKGPGGKGPSTAGFANMHTIPAKAKNKDGGWDFITWYGSLDAALAKLKLQGMASPRRDFYETKEWKEAIVKTPQWARVPEIADTGDIWPFARYTRVNAVWNPAMEAMFLGKVPPKQGIPELQTKVNEILPQPPQG